MNKFIQIPFCMTLCAMMSASMISCSDNNNAPSVTDNSENTLKTAVVPYVDNTVIPTYKDMADEAIQVSNLCAQAKDAYLKGDKAQASQYVAQACEHWKKSRAAWEKSEAFLFGAAADYNIDPHIDSWPLDQAALDKLLNNEDMMNQIGESGGEYVANLGYGLLGFHSLEYILFQLTSDSESEPRDFTKTYNYAGQVVNITNNHLIYMAAVAEDLRNQCVRLEASWAGLENVSAEKREILAETELEPTFDYGTSMRTAGQGGSKYTSYTHAAQEVIQGCIDIVDEVGGQKIGRPNAGTSAEDKNYIESPYALNSVIDFADNIVSVKNAYEGIGYLGTSNEASVSDYVKSVNASVDAEVKSLIDECISKIKLIPEPFTKNATGAEADAAIESLTKLSAALGKAGNALLQ